MATPRPLDVRPLDCTSPADLELAYVLERDGELAAVGRSDATLDSVTSILCGPHGWRDQHAVVYDGGTPVGLLAAELIQPGREVFLDAFAVGDRIPEVLRLLLQRGLDAATVMAADDDEASSDVADPYAMSADFWQVTAAAYTVDQAYITEIEALGFRPIRRFWRMFCDLDGAPSADPQAPPGVTRRVVASEDDERLLHRLFHESFSEHFGHTVEESFESWVGRVRAHAGNREDGWWIAELDGEPVGLCIVDDSKDEFNEGYVRTLGVLSEARGRGVAKWLLGCAAADARRRGRTGIGLAVDGQNTTGATALYESVGYIIRQELDVYCYPLVDSALSR